MLKRALIAIGAVALIVGLLGAGTALAGKKPTDGSKVTVNFDPLSQEYTGKVKSTKRCERVRRVTVLEQPGGLPDSETEPPTTVGIDRTNKDGEYKVNAGGVPDIGTEYFARVKYKRSGKFNCRNAVSETKVYLEMPAPPELP